MACLRPRYHRTRAPSDGSTSSLAAGTGLRALPSTFTRAHPAPFHLPRIRLVLGRAAVSELPSARRPCGPRRGEDAFHRRLQPTSRHEHPSNRRSPESPVSTSRNLSVSLGDRARAFAQRPRLPRSTAPIEIAAEDMNRVEPRLTTRVQLRRGWSWRAISRTQVPPSLSSSWPGAPRETPSITGVFGREMESPTCL